MRTLGGFFGIALLVAGGAYGQHRSGFSGSIPAGRSFGSATLPVGGSSLPGFRTPTGGILHPAGPGPRFNYSRRPTTGVWAYPVPIYIGNYGYGYGDGAYGAYDAMAPIAAGPAAPAQQQPNVIVVYPPAPAYSAYAPMPQPGAAAPAPQDQSAGPQDQPAEPTHYLLAFKDRSIYSAVAYWVDGDTIHYFTSGNTHNQASVSLIDRELTKKLNEGGLEVKLPPEK